MDNNSSPQLRINYGIDLGTTNSAIACMKNGVPEILKIEVIDEIIPSCIYFKNATTQIAGKKAYNALKRDKRKSMKTMDACQSNCFIEFKRTMGSDKKYNCGAVARHFTSEDLSNFVLQAIKQQPSVENLSAAVITVPAMFTVNQKTATIEAARMAGIKHVELLQEPIAAAMAYGLKSDETNGYWLVFDFGGGTFDAALIKTEDHIIQVVDTEGDNYLGGKNLDYAITDKILIPYLRDNYSVDEFLADPYKNEIIRDCLKTYAEEVKNDLSFNESTDIYVDPGDVGEDETGEEIEIDLTVTRPEADTAMRPIFQKAIDLCLDLLKRNNLSSAQISKLILVGGPTYSPLLRTMVREQLTDNIDTSINPMTAVAVGASIYASTIDRPISDEELQNEDVVLDITFDSMTVDSDVWIPVAIKSGAENVNVRFVRTDEVWDSGRTEIDSAGDVIQLFLKENRPNTFRVECYDMQGNRLKCFPGEITIIQGSQVGKATLPYDISLAIHDRHKDRDVVAHLNGLERNQTIPATGQRKGLFTNHEVRAGVETDVLRIPVYQVGSNYEGLSAKLFDLVGEIVVDGDDVDVTIPRNASVDVKVRIDRNEQMTVEAYFPEQQVRVSKKIDTSIKQKLESDTAFVESEMPIARMSLKTFRDEGHDVAKLEDELHEVQEQMRNNNEPRMVTSNLRTLLRKIEAFEEDTEWERIEKEMKEWFGHLEDVNYRFGNITTTREVTALRRRMDEVCRRNDVKMAYTLTEEIRLMHFQLTFVYQCIYRIQDMNRDFDIINWKDRTRARMLLNRGLAEINNEPTRERLQPLVVEVHNLLPDDEKGRTAGLHLA